MAYGKKTGGKDFQPGNSYGKGRPQLSSEEKKLRKLALKEYIERINKLYFMTREQLSKYIQSKEADALDMHIASVIMRGIQEGDLSRLEGLISRLVGRMPNYHKIEEDSTKRLTIEAIRDSADNTFKEPETIAAARLLAEKTIE